MKIKDPLIPIDREAYFLYKDGFFFTICKGSIISRVFDEGTEDNQPTWIYKFRVFEEYSRIVDNKYYVDVREEYIIPPKRLEYVQNKLVDLNISTFKRYHGSINDFMKDILTPNYDEKAAK